MRPPDASVGGGPVIVFDGVCVLCSGWVSFLLRVDRRQRYRFATMQGAAGAALMRAHGLDPDDPMSFLLVDGAQARIDSDGVIAVVTGLGGAWRFAGLARALPRPLRDAAYRVVARRRYRWFGRKPTCELPDPAQAHRFLDG